MRGSLINDLKMVAVVSLLHWKVALFWITLNTVICEEDIESIEIGGNEEIPPETWDNEEYENWEIQETKDQDDMKDDLTEDSTWQMSQEEQDSVLYDLYEKQPERILEVDEEEFALSDSWIILDSNDEEEDMDDTQEEFLNPEEISNEEDFYEESDTPVGDLSVTGWRSHPDNIYHQADNLECDETVAERKTKRAKSSAKKRNKDEFYFKHKEYGKKGSKKGSTSTKIPNWKQNCCIRGKKVGNGRRTFLSKNIFQECKDRARSLASRMSRSCKWIFWSCCEARALRRYYIHNQSSQRNVC